MPYSKTVASYGGDAGYAHLEYSIVIKRKLLYYTMNFIIPCAMLSMMSIVSFILKPGTGERIDFGTANVCVM